MAPGKSRSSMQHRLRVRALPVLMLIGILIAGILLVGMVGATTDCHNVSTPVNYTWNVPGVFWTDSVGTYFTNISADYLINNYPRGGIYYVDVINGSDSNSGLSPGAAFKTLNAAQQYSNVTIYVYPGEYNRAQIDHSLNYNMTIIGMGPGVVLTNWFEAGAWNKEPSLTYAYYRVRSGTAQVWDTYNRDSLGFYRNLSPEPDAATVDTVAGSWHINSSNYVFVRTFDGVAPNDTAIKLSYGNPVMQQIDGGNLLLKNITIYGGDGAIKLRANASNLGEATFYAKDCNFGYSDPGYNVINAFGAYTIIENSSAFRGHQDGYNYQAYLSTVAHVIEINVSAHDNGYVSNDQGSTTHGGAASVRVNGQYYNNSGPNIQDIEDNTVSWLLGSKSYGTHLTVDQDYKIDNGNASMWLDHVSGAATLTLVVGGSSNWAYVSNSTLPRRSIAGWQQNYTSAPYCGGLLCMLSPTAPISVWYPPGCVNFRDTSTGSPTAWTWTFGDGTTGTTQNPVHCYRPGPGSYTVQLNASTSTAYSLNSTRVQVII